MTNILVVDPVAQRRAQLRGYLERSGFGVVEAEDLPGPHGLGAAHIAAVVANARLPSGDGIALVPLARPTPVLLLAEDANIPAAVAAVREGAADYLSWPVSPGVLIAALERASADPQTAADTTADTGEEWPIFGACPPMLDLFERIRAAARTDAAVLVRGEAGTGKELVARALHARGSRRHAPMMALNCAAIPETLIEAELFGHAHPNAPTAGLVAAAGAGTLFLNEVGDLPLEAQARLVAVLREPTVGTSAPTDVRVIAATHRNLDQLARNGQFRADLLGYLAAVTLTVPPLRERGDDIVALARILGRRAAARMNKPEPRFSAAALAAIGAYPWPGNVRELENAVERATILSDGGEIHAESLAIETGSRDHPDRAGAQDADDGVSLEEYFVRFVTENQDQFTETELAGKLGISRKNLWERRKRHGIPRRRTRKRGPRRDPG